MRDPLADQLRAAIGDTRRQLDDAAGGTVDPLPPGPARDLLNSWLGDLTPDQLPPGCIHLRSPTPSLGLVLHGRAVWCPACANHLLTVLHRTPECDSCGRQRGLRTVAVRVDAWVVLMRLCRHCRPRPTVTDQDDNHPTTEGPD